MTMIRSASVMASERSWVMKTTVWRFSPHSRSSSACNSSLVWRSSAPNGSSISRISGSLLLRPAHAPVLEAEGDVAADGAPGAHGVPLEDVADVGRHTLDRAAIDRDRADARRHQLADHVEDGRFAAARR